MTITKTQESQKMVLQLAGRLDTTTAPQLEETLKENLNGITELVLDMEKLEYVSSAGLRVLLSAQKAMNAVQGKMEVHHVCEDIKEVFEITGFCEILTVV